MSTSKDQYSQYSGSMFHSSGYHKYHHDAAVTAASAAIHANHHRSCSLPVAFVGVQDDWTMTPPSPPPLESTSTLSSHHNQIGLGLGSSLAFPEDGGVCVDNHADRLDIDCLSAMLRREVRDYSAPIPLRYYPREFHEDAPPVDKKKGNSSASIGPWRRRISGWMCDVVDHFKYDRDAVFVALHYVDRYVAHLLVAREQRLNAGAGSSVSSRAVAALTGGNSNSNGVQLLKRREFQLIAVTSLYMAIKIHGTLIEDLEADDEEYVKGDEGGAMMSGYDDGDDKHGHDDGDKYSIRRSSDTSTDRIQSISERIVNLRRRQRRERVRGFRGNCDDDDEVSKSRAKPSPLPFRPRKRGMLSGPLRLTSFVELSRGLFTAKDIIATESKILNSCEYKVNPPTPAKIAIEMVRVLEECMAVAKKDHCRFSFKRAPSIEDADPDEVVGVHARAKLAKAVRVASRNQAEVAAGSPVLALGTFSSAVAYAAALNAIQDEFDEFFHRHVGEQQQQQRSNCNSESSGSYELEDYQRHYRREPRKHPHHMSMYPAWDVQRQLETWRDEFCHAVYRASDGTLSPDATDVREAREELRLQTGTTTEEGITENGQSSSEECASPPPTSPSSSNEHKKNETPPRRKKKIQPRSPRSVIGGMAAGIRRGSSGNSFFSGMTSLSAMAGSGTSYRDTQTHEQVQEQDNTHEHDHSRRTSSAGTMREPPSSSNVHSTRHSAGAAMEYHYNRQTMEMEPLPGANDLYRRNRNTHSFDPQTTANHGIPARATTPEIIHRRRPLGIGSSGSGYGYARKEHGSAVFRIAEHRRSDPSLAFFSA